MTASPPLPPEPSDPPPPYGSPAPVAPPPMAPVAPARAGEPWASRDEVRAALVVVGVLAVAGVLAGLVWLWWSPPRGIALALGAHSLIPDETENFIAADGRFAVLTAVIGVVSGFAVYCWRTARGPVLAVGLAVGSGVGAALTATVGRAFGGGVSGAATREIVTPPLELRAVGLLALQAAVALLIYGLLVTVAARDDLGVTGRVDDADEPDGIDGAEDALPAPATVFDAPPSAEPPRA